MSMEYLNPQKYGGAAPPADTLAALQLLDLFRDPDRDIDRIVEFISRDPSLTAETLKRCNNALYWGSERITDVFEAVSRLGFYELYGIIAASMASRTLPPSARISLERDMFPDGEDNFD